MFKLDTFNWNKKYLLSQGFSSVSFLCLFFQQTFFFILVPRTLDRESGTLKKSTHILWYGPFNEMQNNEIWKLLKTWSPWVHMQFTTSHKLFD